MGEVKFDLLAYWQDKLEKRKRQLQEIGGRSTDGGDTTSELPPGAKPNQEPESIEAARTKSQEVRDAEYLQQSITERELEAAESEERVRARAKRSLESWTTNMTLINKARAALSAKTELGHIVPEAKIDLNEIDRLLNTFNLAVENEQVKGGYYDTFRKAAEWTDREIVDGIEHEQAGGQSLLLIALIDVALHRNLMV